MISGVQVFVMALATAVLMSGCVTKPASPDTGNYGTARTLPERMTDFGIQRNVVNGLSNIEGVTRDNVRVAVTSFRGDVLLTGEVPTQTIKEQIGTMALSIREVNELYNYLEVVDTPKSQSHTNHERYLQSKIVARLLPSSLKTSQYKIVVRSDVAYVMGEMTKEQQDNEIIEVIRNTDGIRGVVLANKILTTSPNHMVGNAVPSVPDDTTAVYPTYSSNTSYPAGNATYDHMPQGGYTDTGYPTSIYTTGGEPNVPVVTPSNQPQNPPTSSTYPAGHSSSGYVQLYQGTNNP